MICCASTCAPATVLGSGVISFLVNGDAHLLDHALAVRSDDGLQLLKLDLGHVGGALFLYQRKVLDLLLVRDQVHTVPGPIPPDVRTRALPGELVFQIQPVCRFLLRWPCAACECSCKHE